jgi:hypothetical protein
VSDAFANAHGLKPGARLGALINGKRRTLVVAGIALSPEYVFAGLWGMPDQRGFGVFWVDRDVLSAAYDMDGAFTHVAVKLAPGASERSVTDALDRRLATYGGRSAIGRAGPGLERDARQRDQVAARARHRAAVDLPRRRGLPAERRRVAARGDAARADRGAEGARAIRTAPSRRTT